MNADPTPVASFSTGLFRLDDLLIDLHSRRVTRDGVELAVSGLTFDLLVALLHASPGAVSSDVLMERVWPGVVVGLETVSQRVKLLRQSLGDNAERPHYVLTLRSHGYRLMTAAVSVLPEPVPERPRADTAPHRVVASDADTTGTEPATATRAAVPPAAARPWSLVGNRRWLVIALLPVALLLGAGWWGLRQGLVLQTAAPVGVSGPMMTSAARASSIAVIPFANLTGDASKEYIADGIAEELINALDRVPGLRVPARTSSFVYDGRRADIRRIARDLNVATVLEGSLRSAGERLRVSARLVDARTGFPIWTQTFDRQAADLFQLEDELAGQIVTAMRGYLQTDLPLPVAGRPPSQSFDAYQLYLQARATGHGTPDSERQALAIVNEAIARDPDFAQALGYRAFIEAAIGSLGGESARALQSARQDVTRALALSPNLSEALVARGMIEAASGEWVAADESFRGAIASSPTDPFPRNLYVLNILKPVGRLQTARAQLEESYRLAPAYGFTLNELTLISSILGNDEDMARFARINQAVDERPLHWDQLFAIARANERAGRDQDAARYAAQALPEPLKHAGGTAAVDSLYAALANPARRPAALEELEHLVPMLKSPGIDGRTRAFFLSAMVLIGGTDAAYGFVNDLLSSSPGSYLVADWSYLWQPEMHPFRRDRRFQGLMQRLGFIDYWKRYGAQDECDIKNDARLECR